MAEAHLEVYRRFKGSLREHPLRFWPIWTSGLRTAVKQRKALLILYAPPVIATVIFSFVVYMALTLAGQLEQGAPFGEGGDLGERLTQQMILAAANEGLKMLEVVNQMIEFNKGVGLFALLAVAWFGSGLFCEDRKAGAHQLYFARPITRLDYFAGKFLVAAFFSLCAMLVPMLVICLVASFASTDWAFLKEQWDVIPRSAAFSLLWTVVMTSIVLLASSLAPRRSFALIGVFGFLFVSQAVAAILGELVDTRLHAVGVMEDLHALSYAVFGREGKALVSAGDAWLAIAVLVASCWLVIAGRLRRLEVVA
jgi:ABC-type transport system involved in multi-copper enzyme maturation permease subunit